MTGLLDWGHATAEDRTVLPTWECTEPARKVKRGSKWVIQHPRMWELTVQSKIRTFTPPYRSPFMLLVGRDAGGIGAVLMCEELDGPAQVELCFGAVALRHRHKGGGIADEMMSRALDEITTRAFEVGASVVEVTGLIHEENRPSQSMARRAGLRHTGQLGDSPFQQWTVTLLLHQPDDEADR